jgi:hypothetical protein
MTVRTVTPADLPKLSLAELRDAYKSALRQHAAAGPTTPKARSMTTWINRIHSEIELREKTGRSSLGERTRRARQALDAASGKPSISREDARRMLRELRGQK